jgi:CRISPR-associated endonuclease Csn1
MIRETTQAVPSIPVVLGLDIGAKSIGWALIRGPETPSPEIVGAGVRVFEAGVDGDIETGMDSSRAAARRMARQLRRQTARRVQRKRRLFSLLQGAGLLPTTADTSSLSRDSAIKSLDESLLASLATTYGESGNTANKLPYVLRAEALCRPLSPHELGRVFYHLGERRGFKSNRRTDRKAEDTGKVYDGIAAIQGKKGSKTLGEYFAGLDPKADRIRNRYLARTDYEEEFSRIWEAQRPHHPTLTPRLHRKLKRCLFWQRPLKSQKSLLGRCSLLTNRRRCPIAHPVAQEFRLLQAVNHLLIVDEDGIPSVLTDDQRTTLLHALRTEGDLTFPAVKKLLGLKKKGTRFNLEEGGEKRLPGNRTHKAMHDAIGTAWDALSDADKTQLVGIVRGSVDEAALQGQVTKWFPELAQHCAALEKVSLEDAYASHCKKVLVDLVDRMRDGIPYATARADFEATHNLGGTSDPVDQLPPVREFLPSLTNPAVIRALTELRKVVNEIVRVYGKPDTVRIELARDLKKPRKVRQEISKRMREREGERSRAAQQLRSHGITNPSRADIEKILLAEECGWVCPYTGGTFGMADLVGEHAKVDVEHIFPRRYLDDSFMNKTLCMAAENRSVKKDQLPFAAYSGQSAKYTEILARVRAFRSDIRDEKLRRFMADAVDSDFVSRQLVDTAYASREAAKYVGLLYGGVIDVRSDRRVRTSSGRLSALLRSAWKLSSILGTDDSPKGRGVDHRHHAVDAIVVALVTDSLVKAVSDSASKNSSRSSGRWRVEVPEYDTLLEQAMENVKRIVVSHRMDRRLAGRLHEDSIYSPPRLDGNGGTYHVIRKPLGRLTTADIEGDKIVDPRVRRVVQDAYSSLSAALGKTKPADIFGDEANLPMLPNRNGPPVLVRKVRVRVRDNARRIGDHDHRTRHVMRDADGLHHTVIFSKRLGAKETWVEVPTSRLEVKDRHRKQEPIVQLTAGPDSEFVLHLCKGDSVELDDAEGGRSIYVVKGVAGTDIRVVPNWDASTDNRTADTRVRSPNKLRDRRPRVVVVTPAGRVFTRGG